MNPARAGIASIISFAATALCAAQTAHAAIVVATITGTVTSEVISGTARTGLFGLPPGTNLAGQKYKLVYTIDDKKGTGTVIEGKPPYASYIEGTYLPTNPDVVASNPITAAVLTINRVSYDFAGRPDTSVLSASAFRGCMFAVSCYPLIVGFSFSVLRGSPDSIEDKVFANFAFTLPKPTGNPDWESPISADFPATSNGSGFLIADVNENTGETINSVLASFSISSFKVSGPTCDAASALAAQPSCSSTLHLVSPFLLTQNFGHIDLSTLLPNITDWTSVSANELVEAYAVVPGSSTSGVRWVGEAETDRRTGLIGSCRIPSAVLRRRG